MKFFSQKGFTRVELIIFLAIFFAILISGTVAFLEMQKSIRDTKRRADIEIISSSLDVHYNSFENQFCNAPAATYCAANPNWFQGGVPTDPLKGEYLNLPKDGDKDFTICAKLERGGQYCQKNRQ